MIPYVQYDTTTKLVRGAGSCAAEDIWHQHFAEANIEVVVGEIPGAGHYLDYMVDEDQTPMVIVPRPSHSPPSKTEIVADGEDAAVFSGLPAGCEVSVDGETYVVDDGEFVFCSDDPGEYAITLRSPPYLDLVVFVTAKSVP